jgi:hypothetical protein
MEMVTLIQAKQSDLEEVIRNVMTGDMVDCRKFNNIFVSPEVVATMHGVNKLTVINYINDGLIEVEPHQPRESYRIQLSHALKLDFKELRKNLKIR